MSTSTGSDKEKALLRKYGNYNSGTKTLSKNPKPQIHPNLSLTMRIKPRETTFFNLFSMLFGTISHQRLAE